MASPDHSEAQAHPKSPITTQSSIKIEAFDLQQNGNSEYRILVDGKKTKFISLSAGTIVGKNLLNFPCSPLVGVAALPALPPGDWNHGIITKCPLTDKPVWTTSLNDWPGVTTLWHGVTIDQSEFTSVMVIRNNLEIVTCPQYPGLNLAFKFATFPHRIPAINQETMIYKTITEKRAQIETAHEDMW